MLKGTNQYNTRNCLKLCLPQSANLKKNSEEDNCVLTGNMGGVKELKGETARNNIE